MSRGFLSTAKVDPSDWTHLQDRQKSLVPSSALKDPRLDDVGTGLSVRGQLRKSIEKIKLSK